MCAAHEHAARPGWAGLWYASFWWNARGEAAQYACQHTDISGQATGDHAESVSFAAIFIIPSWPRSAFAHSHRWQSHMYHILTITNAA